MQREACGRSWASALDWDRRLSRFKRCVTLQRSMIEVMFTFKVLLLSAGLRQNMDNTAREFYGIYVKN